VRPAGTAGTLSVLRNLDEHLGGADVSPSVPCSRPKAGSGMPRRLLVTTAAALLLAPAARAYVPGIDVSHFNGAVGWARVAGAGYKFVYAKAAEGSTLDDAPHAASRPGTGACKLRFAAYRFASPQAGATRPIESQAAALAHARDPGGRRGRARPLHRRHPAATGRSPPRARPRAPRRPRRVSAERLDVAVAPRSRGEVARQGDHLHLAAFLADRACE